MTWQSVGTHTFMPTDTAVEIGSFDLAAGQDTIWVRITQLNDPADWPFSYGILSWRNADGTPLGSIKAYSNRFGEVFRLGNGLPPSVGTGSIWFEPRGFNLAWLKAGFPWELQFEAQAGASDLTSGYWDRDASNQVITPKTSGDNLDMTPGWIKAKNLIITDGTGSPVEKEVPGFQQGTWTPVPSQGSSAAIQPLRNQWTRVGNTVQLWGFIQALSDRSAEQILILGLPYPVLGVCSGACTSSYIAPSTGGITIAYAQYSSSRARDEISFLATTDTKANPWTNPEYANISSNSNAMYFNLAFLTSDTTWQPINGAVVT